MNPNPRSIYCVGALLLAAGCDGHTGPGASSPVQFHVAAAAPAPGAGGGALVIDGIRMIVVGAALGSGEQFGCVDCQGTETAVMAPALVAVPAGAGPVLLATEEVAPGRYSEVEITLGGAPASLLGATPGWQAGASLEIAGSFRGVPFTVSLPIEGSFRETLVPAIDVPAAGTASVAVTVTLPVATWFADTALGTLDPGDPVQRARIAANAQRSFAPAEITTPESAAALRLSR